MDHPTIPMPFAVLPRHDVATREALRAAALHANDRYVNELIAGYSFCPYARASVRDGSTKQYVYFIDSEDLSELYELMASIASDEGLAVTQIIFPMLDVDSRDWGRFCMALTAEGHRRMGGYDVLACAPLHPQLAFKDVNEFALIPLFRRSPDPTIQWVRLDVLEALQKGRENDTTFMPPELIADLPLDAGATKPLYERVAENNHETTRELGVDKVVALFAEIADAARARYDEILSDRVMRESLEERDVSS